MTPTLLWRHNEHDGVSNHQPHECLLSLPSRRRSKKTSKLRVTGLCEGNSPETGEFPAQMASNAENVSIWWRHHEGLCFLRDKTSYRQLSKSRDGALQVSFRNTATEMPDKLQNNQTFFSPHMYATAPRSPLIQTSILAWISNHMPSKVWDEISYPFAYIKCRFDIGAWVSNFTPLFLMDVIIYPCWN